MKAKVFLILFSLLLIFSFGFKKAYDFIKLAELKNGAAYYKTDPLGNVFLVFNDNSIEKYNRNGKFLTSVNTKIYGKPDWIDASNPFEVYVFYSLQNKIILYDNLLSQRGEINLNDIRFPNIVAGCRSFDNGLWAFDTNEMKLKRFDKTLNLKFESGNILAFFTGDVFPVLVAENQDRVFVSFKNQGILVFDVFANYLKTIPLEGSEEFSVFEDKIHFCKNDQIFSYHLKSLKLDSIALPFSKGFEKANFEKERLYVLRDNSLTLFSF